MTVPEFISGLLHVLPPAVLVLAALAIAAWLVLGAPETALWLALTAISMWIDFAIVFMMLTALPSRIGQTAGISASLILFALTPVGLYLALRRSRRAAGA
jgi:hypothetical protein